MEDFSKMVQTLPGKKDEWSFKQVEDVMKFVEQLKWVSEYNSK